MNWLFIAVLAQIILGTSAVFDKALLKRKFFDPFTYTFWIGVLGLFAVVFLPFGFQLTALNTILIALAAGAIFILAMVFMIYALYLSEASQTLPIIGGISPIFTLVFGFIFLSSWLGSGDYIAFTLLILGSLVLFAIEKKEVRKISIILILASSFLFGLSNVLSKVVFETTNFVTGFFWIKVGGAILALAFLFSGNIRQRIFHHTDVPKIKHYFLYFSNRLYAGIGSLLVSFAIKISQNPALVDALQSIKYIVIFIFAWILLKEKFSGRILAGKIFAALLIFSGIFLLGLIDYARSLPIDLNRNITWGITYSAKFSRQLGIDWQKTYEEIMFGFHPKKVRLVAYWEDIEKEKGKFDFSETDWLLQKTKENNAMAILVVGLKTPRWPECHIPDWAQNLPGDEKENQLKAYLKELVAHYKNNTAISVWQIENEPFLIFGNCPTRSVDSVKKEIALVRSLDNRPILLTDGGEFGLWYRAAEYGDMFGTTMYRKTYPPSVGWLVGNIEYPIGPSYFKLKEKITRFLINDPKKPFIVSELQAEPWDKLDIPKLSYERQVQLFSPEYFIDTIKYAKETGFSEYYLWGSEWWYYMKEKYNDSRYWDIVKKVLHSQ